MWTVKVAGPWAFPINEHHSDSMDSAREGSVLYVMCSWGSLYNK